MAAFKLLLLFKFVGYSPNSARRHVGQRIQWKPIEDEARQSRLSNFFVIFREKSALRGGGDIWEEMDWNYKVEARFKLDLILPKDMKWKRWWFQTHPLPPHKQNMRHFAALFSNMYNKEESHGQFFLKAFELPCTSYIFGWWKLRLFGGTNRALGYLYSEIFGKMHMISQSCDESHPLEFYDGEGNYSSKSLEVESVHPRPWNKSPGITTLPSRQTN